MNGPRRLLDDAEGLERAILDSARLDDPHPERRRRLVGVIAGGATSLAATGVAASTSLGLKVVFGLAILGGGGLALRARPPAAAPAVTVPSAATSPVVSVAVAPALARAIVSAPVVTATASIVAQPAPVSPPPPPATLQAAAAGCALGDEVALLDVARTAVRANAGAQALASVARYETACPNGALALEANVLRVEAHAASGDAASAEKLARAFVASHPSSPYEARVRKFIPTP
ncbi:MAG: hypothetical protein IPJ34_26650 [Myxococcales bacterium]|nr:hypothetical protein [Myxococcales bacterium]